MRNHIIVILAVLLLISGVVIYLLIRERFIAQRDRTLEAREFRSKAKESLSKIEARDAQISTLLNDRAEDSVRQVKKEAAFISRISALKSRVTGPAVVQDTIIVIQDSLISVVRNSRDTLYITDNQVIDSLKQNIYDFDKMFTECLIFSEKIQRDYYKEKKKRWSLGPHVGYGFRGADVGISIQYSLLRL